MANRFTLQISIKNNILTDKVKAIQIFSLRTIIHFSEAPSVIVKFDISLATLSSYFFSLISRRGLVYYFVSYDLRESVFV